MLHKISIKRDSRRGIPFLSKPKAFIWEKFRIIKWYDLFIKNKPANKKSRLN